MHRVNVECFAGRVDGGIWRNSSYRSEAYGLLAGLQYAYWSGILGDVRHILDNDSVVRVYQDCETRNFKLTCSQDVWDEIIWYKRAIGSRYKVSWRRGHPEDRGPILHIEDRANHLADGLTKVGYETAVDMRHYFQHSRRWHVRMGGLRHFDDIRSSARIHIGARFLRNYKDAQDDKRPLDLGLPRALTAGKSTKSSWGRAENTKFVHLQLATLTRLRDWGYRIPSTTCRACKKECETTSHILVSCRAPR